MVRSWLVRTSIAADRRAWEWCELNRRLALFQARLRGAWVRRGWSCHSPGLREPQLAHLPLRAMTPRLPISTLSQDSCLRMGCWKTPLPNPLPTRGAQQLSPMSKGAKAPSRREAALVTHGAAASQADLSMLSGSPTTSQAAPLPPITGSTRKEPHRKLKVWRLRSLPAPATSAKHVFPQAEASLARHIS
eukprot:GGOE01022844.1.p2 GENE.GGOE01022844.1~~GGOE01022844.1.p2  ORF type:complete len:190 (-),score=19.28 GGOE01022844.1:364-933(-)